KKTLNLSIEETIKHRAKRIARKRGMSVSRFFEKLVTEQDDPDEFTPEPGTATYELVNLLSESEKRDDPDYGQLRHEALKEKYDLVYSTYRYQLLSGCCASPQTVCCSCS